MIRLSIPYDAYRELEEKFFDLSDKAEAAESAGIRDIDAEQERDRVAAEIYDAMFFEED